MTDPDQDYQRLLAQEELIIDATEMISQLMDAKGVSRAQLAARIGSTRGFITQVLSGSRNMTLRTLADLAFVLDAKVQMATKPEVQSHAIAQGAGATASARWPLSPPPGWVGWSYKATTFPPLRYEWIKTPTGMTNLGEVSRGSAPSRQDKVAA